MQCFEIAAHTFLHARGLRWRRFKQCGNLFCDDLAHGQIVVGDHVETTLGFRHVFCRSGHLDPADFGMRCGEHFRKTVQRECERATLPRESCVAFEWFQIVIVEHFVGDDGHVVVPAQADDRLAFRRFDVRTGRIVGVDEHQRADAIAVRAFQRGFQFGHVDVPGAVESLLVFDHVDAFEACDRFDERIAGFRCEHGVTGITQQFDKPRVGFGS